MLPLLLACSGLLSHTDGKCDIANEPCVLGRDSREWIMLETTMAPAIPEEYQWRLDKRVCVFITMLGGIYAKAP